MKSFRVIEMIHLNEWMYIWMYAREKVCLLLICWVGSVVAAAASDVSFFCFILLDNVFSSLNTTNMKKERVGAID